MTSFRIIDEGEYGEPMHHALDEVLTRRLADGEMQPTLRFWYRNEKAVPLGRFQAFENEVQTDYTMDNDVTIVRRITGGGAMYVEPGNVVTYSMYLPPGMVPDDIEQSYAELDAWVVEALQQAGLDVEHQPLNDIMHADGKIGGAAQLRKSGAVLHHATLSYDLDIEEMLRVLRIGEEKLSDKAVQSAEKRVAVMRDHVDHDRQAIIGQMKDYFRDTYGGEDGSLEEKELAEARELAEEKFSSPAWNRKL